MNVMDLTSIDYWMILGFFGQAIFFSRFIIQWVYSEKKKKSIIPIEFWYLSIVGAVIVFIYAIYRKDPVFFVGQFFAILIYFRNLRLIGKSNQIKESIFDK